MDNNFDTAETAQKFFDRFFAYDLLDRYPNHKVAFEAEYSLRLLWSAEKVCIQDWSFSGERVREILYDELTIEILLNAIGAYRIYCTAPWDLSIIILAMLTLCKYDPDLLEPIKMNEIRQQSMICFAGSGFLEYANAKNKADFFSYAKGKFFPLPQRIFSLGLSSGEILVYAYLLCREDRKTFKCHPSYRRCVRGIQAKWNNATTRNNPRNSSRTKASAASRERDASRKSAKLRGRDDTRRG